MFEDNEIDIELSFSDNIKAGEHLHTDKGYQLSTHEKQAEFAKKREQQTCIECNKPATCVRHTQFAGDHPYCKEHGMQEEDYFVDDSYTYWTEL